MCNRYTPGRYDDPVFARLGPTWGDLLPRDFPKIGPYGPAPIFRPHAQGGVEVVLAQWGMIRPGSPLRRPLAKDGRPLLTNNARSETMRKLPTFRQAWERGQRCLIPAYGFDEPNWESGRNVWWEMRRADRAPWGVAGLWSDWTDPDTGEIVPSFTMPTINVDHHPLLNRLHKPDPKLPPDAQDKRAIVPLDPETWQIWLNGTAEEAWELLQPLPADVFDAGPAEGRLRELASTAPMPDPADPHETP
jgi:putative SOS response-associated peptidase YedK